MHCKPLLLAAGLLAGISSGSQAQTPARTVTQPRGETLYAGFQNPSNAAKPRVWWHWMNGNITKEGIRKDLEWMHRSGIGGFQNFDASLGTPQIVEKRLTYMTSDWKDAFAFTAKLADSLKLEMAIAGSPGWSESGGPWVKPEDGMKKLVWSEVRVQGGATGISIPAPPHITGPFQNIPFAEDFAAGEEQKTPPTYYRDISVVAYKVPEADIPLSQLNPVITSSAGQFNLTQLTDGDLATTKLLPSDSVKGYAWIQFAFPQPVTIKGVTMVGGGDKGPFGLNGEMKDTRSLEYSDDGVSFKRITYIPAGNVLQQTISISPVTAKYFRVTVKNPPPKVDLSGMVTGNFSATPSPGTNISELVLHTASRINMFEEKSAFAPAGNLAEKANDGAVDAISFKDIINLTDKLRPDGSLDWTAPPGQWNIIRFGYSLMGITNHPASPEATGFEVDKLDPDAINRYFTNYLDQYKSASGGLMGAKGGLQFMVTDSWEAGAQNWTANLPNEFRTRRGYDMVPWMPVLSGHIIKVAEIIKSAEASEQFLRDFRQTLSELVEEYHYDALTEILNRYGMKRYTESHENGRALIADGMDVKRKAAVPMSAMWTPGGIGGGSAMHEADIRESASVAHIYGQNLVAAESLTAFGIGGNAWSYSPEKLKPTADLELASGLNRFVIHTSVHQPVDDKIPGLGLGPFGQWFTRHETWANKAGAWTDYLSRSSYMLQQGKFVADIAYFYGEDNNITSLFGEKLPDVPKGYAFDFINPDALINLLSVKNGKLVTPSGMSYSLLALDSNCRIMSLPVLRKIRELVKAGAVVTGPAPTIPSGLKDNTGEFRFITDVLWNAPAAGLTTVNGKIITGQSLGQVLDSLGVEPDVIFTPNAKLMYVHRKLGSQEIYWVNNRTDKDLSVEADFRVAGKKAEIWHPETGEKELASYTIGNGRTKLKLDLAPNDAVFVVFSGKSTSNSMSLPPVTQKELATVSGEWTIHFQEKRGAPAMVTVNELKSWTENPDNGIKYFSGTANYDKTIQVGKDWLAKENEIWIDLGEVKNIAEVTLNGKPIGTVWKKPFLVNIGTALKPGANKLEVSVTNLWVNRLIGDMQPGATKITYTTMPFYQAGSPLLPSGLMGPVRILSRKKE